jgi:23S rRNA (uracil1939-C5)-methyltransferase
MARQRPREVPVQKGDEILVTVDGFGDGPDSLCHFDDYVVFVPGVLPGETRAPCAITSATRKFGRGELLTIERRAPERVEPRCNHFLQCGGCHRQHQAYPAQLRSKQERLQRTLDSVFGARGRRRSPRPCRRRPRTASATRSSCTCRTTRAAASCRPCTAPAAPSWSPSTTARRAIRWRGTSCRIARSSCSTAAAPRLGSVVRAARTAAQRAGAHDHLGDAHLVLVATKPEIPGLHDLLDDAAPRRRHVDQRQPQRRRPGPPARPAHRALVSGRPHVHEEPLAGLRYRISPTVFFQTSPRMAEQLIAHVVDWLHPGERDDVADLYCGAGLLTLPLARARDRRSASN